LFDGDGFGALTSLIYNRGPGMAGDDRSEMREIRDAMQRCDFLVVADYIRSMERLWPKVPGLRLRRRWEADTFAVSAARVIADSNKLQMMRDRMDALSARLEAQANG
jgi:hypothetical protein